MARGDMGNKKLLDLVSRWTSAADDQAQWGGEAQAKLLHRCAKELEATIQEWHLEALTITDAVTESGYSYSAIQQMLAHGEVQNAGVKNKPRIRRCDLPRKAGRSSLRLVRQDEDLVDQVLAG